MAPQASDHIIWKLLDWIRALICQPLKKEQKTNAFCLPTEAFFPMLMYSEGTQRAGVITESLSVTALNWNVTLEAFCAAGVSPHHVIPSPAVIGDMTN